MSRFADLCRAHRSSDDAQTAAAVLAVLKVRGDAAKVLLPCVANSVRLVLRGDTRTIEWSVFNQQVNEGAHGKYSYQDLMRESFALLDGRRVRWADATIDDHEQRIAFLTAQRNGIEVSIARHEAAIAQLRSTGATCLGAIESAAA